MPSTTQISNVASLQDKLKAKLEKDRQQTAKLINEHFEALASDCKAKLTAELNTIDNAIKDRSTAINEELSRIGGQRLRPMWILVLTVFLILAVICGGTWGTLQYLSIRIERQLQEVKELNAQLMELKNKGGKIQFNACGPKKRMCVKVNKDQWWDENKGLWMVPEGY